jgi:hypothetical protein
VTLKIFVFRDFSLLGFQCLGLWQGYAFLSYDGTEVAHEAVVIMIKTTDMSTISQMSPCAHW